MKIVDMKSNLSFLYRISIFVLIGVFFFGVFQYNVKFQFNITKLQNGILFAFKNYTKESNSTSHKEKNLGIPAIKADTQFRNRLSEVIDIRYEQLSLVNVSCKNWLLNSTNVKNRTNTVIQNKEQLINLKDVIKQKCYDKKPVPNVIHYVWLGLKKKEMKFYQFLSVYSCHKYLHPCLILFHGETLPYGRYWDLLQTVVPNIIHVKISSPTNIEGIQLKHIEHKADIVRFHALRDYGGIYMDTDSVALKPMDNLRSYNFTLGIENPGNLAIATILSAKNPEFLRIWLEHYISFDPNNWGLHSIVLPYRLSKKYPNLIHVEKDYTFYYGGSGSKLISGNMKWDHMYAIHLSMRYFGSIPFNETTIRKMKSPLGEIGRHILFNNKNLCSS